MSLRALTAVAAGSALGGAARYLIGLALATRSGTFPVGTLLVNVAGGFLLGLFVRSASGSTSVEMRLFLTVGLCGGFTTFSTFSLETVRLLQDEATARALAYVVASVLLSMFAVWLGLLAGRVLDGARV